ncbi:MAG: FprA family A-type flavoprotein [Candidatus Gastranaerophilales bacterium]|nr:FprA family A-type flavoprotein [Candidatus Gastranaerophilales bacterium]
MAVLKVKDNIFAVSTIDWDRRLFDQLIPLPHGTSYNAFVIRASEKTVLVDTSYPPRTEEFLSNLEELNVEKIDYIVINHCEQDHSGALPKVLEKYPDAQVLASAKCKELLMSHLWIPEEKITAVDNTTQIQLGDKTLTFMISPWVHWPDTMFTYVPEDKIIFTTDFTGSHLATSDLFVRDECLVYESAKRYYAEIMMPFRAQVKKYTEQLANMVKEGKLEIIAPSHGPLYDKPEFILDAYRDWSADEPKKEVIIPYVSMYNSTGKMVDYLTNKLMEKGIKVTPFNLTQTDLGELAVSLVDASTMIVGMPMVLMGPHPAAVYAATIVNALRPRLKYVSVIGSYGWAVQQGEKMDEQIKAFIPNLKAECLTSVFAKGLPTEETFKKLDMLVEEVAAKNIS